MPRPRTPKAKAELTGQAAMHPERFRHGNRSEPDSQGPLGDAPDFLKAGEKSAWNSFRLEWSWLTYEDRPAVAGLSQMRAILEDPLAQKGAAFYTAYRLMLSEHGGTPVSRSKIYQPKTDEPDDPFAALGPAN